MWVFLAAFCVSFIESCQPASLDDVHHVDTVYSAAGASDAEEHRFFSETQNSVGLVFFCTLECKLVYF